LDGKKLVTDLYTQFCWAMCHSPVLAWCAVIVAVSGIRCMLWPSRHWFFLGLVAIPFATIAVLLDAWIR
jgi:hypothetical protein